MILNSYAILAGFIAIVRGFCAMVAVGLALFMLRKSSSQFSEHVRMMLENCNYLLFMLAFLMLILNVISWPLLYLLLQSYVQEMPDVMCIFGVTQVGLGSHGPARFLPPLIEWLQRGKPLLIFLTGAWFILYLINCRTAAAALGKQVIVLLLILGTISFSDVVAEVAYLTIPKKEIVTTNGCCTITMNSPLSGRDSRPGVTTDALSDGEQLIGYFIVNLAMIAFLIRNIRSSQRDVARCSQSHVLICALVSLIVSQKCLKETIATWLMHLPYHCCVYDMIARVPESIAGIAFFYLGVFAAGWSCLVASFELRVSDQVDFRGWVRGLMQLSLFGYSASLVMASTALICEL